MERISTQALFDHLEVPQRGRTSAACRRLAKLMRDLGWTAVKARFLGQSGFKDQVRGYARNPVSWAPWRSDTNANGSHD